MSFGDYLFNEPYARCSEKKDAASIRYLESDYLQTAREDLIDRRAMMQSLNPACAADACWSLRRAHVAASPAAL
jgi:hypothetical protein